MLMEEGIQLYVLTISKSILVIVLRSDWVRLKNVNKSFWSLLVYNPPENLGKGAENKKGNFEIFTLLNEKMNFEKSMVVICLFFVYCYSAPSHIPLVEPNC